MILIEPPACPPLPPGAILSFMAAACLLAGDRRGAEAYLLELLAFTAFRVRCACEVAS